MKKYKVEISNGISTAPYVIIMAESETKAEKIARETNGLGRFESWTFTAREIR